MTPEDLTARLRAVIADNLQFTTWTVSTPHIMALVRLCVEEEREACAKLCDDRVAAYKYATDSWAQEHISEARHLAQAIRARGNT